MLTRKHRIHLFSLALIVAGGLLLPPASARAECSPTERSTAEQNYSTAYQFVSASQWTEAMPSLQAGIEACPEHWPSVELMAQAKMRTKSWTEAVDWYTKLVDGQYDGLLALAELRVLQPYGYVLLQNRDWNRAESVYEAVLTQDARNKEAHERLVYAYDKSGNTEEAIDHLQELYGLAQTDEEKSDLATRIGNAYKKIGDTETAKQWFEMGGGATSGMFAIGVDHMNAKEWSEAADAFRSFLDGKPQSAPAWKNLGQCLQQLDRKREAAEAFEKALEIDPGKHDVASSLGFVYSDLEQWSRAADLAQQAIQDWPEEDRSKASMYFLMGKVYEKRDGNYEAAIGMFQKARGADDPYWAELAAKEIDRQRQLIQIRDARSGSGR